MDEREEKEIVAGNGDSRWCVSGEWKSQIVSESGMVDVYYSYLSVIKMKR